MKSHNTTNRKPVAQQLDMEKFEITEKKGSHKAGTNCPCKPTTDSGRAHRDIRVERTAEDQETKWWVIRFYHQAAVVKKNAEITEVDTYGFGNRSTTRERINWELSEGFQLVQRSHRVKLRVPNGGLVDVPESFQIVFGSGEVLDAETGELVCHYAEATE